MHKQSSLFGHQWVTTGTSGIALPTLHQSCAQCGRKRDFDVWSRTSTRNAIDPSTIREVTPPKDAA